jgi:8-oxo-dGTP pyrophosphatase MutT (NUDIX family)
MIISKWRIAAAIHQFPLVLRAIHTVWRLTRPHFSAGVIGVLFNPLGEVLVVEHVYHAPPRWGLPGGYMDRGEDPQVTIAREMREELELSVEVGPVVALQRADGNHLDIAFLCRSDGSVGHLCDELLDYRWVSLDQLPNIRRFHRQAITTALALVDINV